MISNRDLCLDYRSRTNGIIEVFRSRRQVVSIRGKDWKCYAIGFELENRATSQGMQGGL
jgi:hypothetical protein